jgi:hypothetical protein
MISLNIYLWQISKWRWALRIPNSEFCLRETISISQYVSIDKCNDMNVHMFHPLDGLRLSQEIRGGGTRRYNTL